MHFEPPGKGRQSIGLNPVDPPAAFGRRDDQSGRFQKLEMLHDRRARNGQASCEIARRPWRASEALKNDYPDRMTEQGKQTQHLSKLRRFGVRLCHPRSVTPD